jgi:hypothetical protein
MGIACLPVSIRDGTSPLYLLQGTLRGQLSLSPSPRVRVPVHPSPVVRCLRSGVLEERSLVIGF